MVSQCEGAGALGLEVFISSDDACKRLTLGCVAGRASSALAGRSRDSPSLRGAEITMPGKHTRIHDTWILTHQVCLHTQLRHSRGHRQQPRLHNRGRWLKDQLGICLHALISALPWRVETLEIPHALQSYLRLIIETTRQLLRILPSHRLRAHHHCPIPTTPLIEVNCSSAHHAFNREERVICPPLKKAMVLKRLTTRVHMKLVYRLPQLQGRSQVVASMPTTHSSVLRASPSKRSSRAAREMPRRHDRHH